MTDKELKHLTRADLIEIIYQMTKEEEELREKLEASEKELRDQNIRVEKAGTLAEAALDINGVFEKAQKAADEYLKRIYASHSDTEAECRKMLEETEAECRRREEECRKREEEADAKIEQKWENFQKVTQKYIKAHNELESLLNP